MGLANIISCQQALAYEGRQRMYRVYAVWRANNTTGTQIYNYFQGEDTPW